MCELKNKVAKMKVQLEKKLQEEGLRALGL